MEEVMVAIVDEDKVMGVGANVAYDSVSNMVLHAYSFASELRRNGFEAVMVPAKKFLVGWGHR